MVNRPYANTPNGHWAVGARVRRSPWTLNAAAKSLILTVPCGTFVKMHDRRPEEEAS
jgi:hypothetical protein